MDEKCPTLCRRSSEAWGDSEEKHACLPKTSVAQSTSRRYCVPPAPSVLPDSHIELSPGFEVKEAFLEDSEKFYKAKAATLSGNGEEDLAAINSWVKEATRGHIPKVLSELPANVAMILLNAVHFQGEPCCPPPRSLLD